MTANELAIGLILLAIMLSALAITALVTGKEIAILVDEQNNSKGSAPLRSVDTFGLIESVEPNARSDSIRGILKGSK